MLPNPGKTSWLLLFVGNPASFELHLFAGPDRVMERGEECFIAWNPKGHQSVKYRFRSQWGSHVGRGVAPSFFRIERSGKPAEDRHQLRPGEGYSALINIYGLFLKYSANHRPSSPGT